MKKGRRLKEKAECCHCWQYVKDFDIPSLCYHRAEIDKGERELKKEGRESSVDMSDVCSSISVLHQLGSNSANTGRTASR